MADLSFLNQADIDAKNEEIAEGPTASNDPVVRATEEAKAELADLEKSGRKPN